MLIRRSIRLTPRPAQMQGVRARYIPDLAGLG